MGLFFPPPRAGVGINFRKQHRTPHFGLRNTPVSAESPFESSSRFPLHVAILGPFLAPNTMRNRTYLALLLSSLTVAVGCQSGNTSASMNTAPQAVVHAPQVTFTPSVWETAGSEIVPSLKITTPAHNETVTYRFEYEGDGSVELPDPMTLEPGETQLMVKSPFRTPRVKETAQGVVRLIWNHPEVGDKVAGQWNVVQRPSVLSQLRVSRADNLIDVETWDVTYAITVELDPVEEWVDQNIANHRDVMFEASAGSGERSPRIHVLADVDPTEYTTFPKEIIPSGEYKAYIVCIKRPKLPQRRRPFLHVKSRSGGDELERYLKLPF